MKRLEQQINIRTNDTTQHKIQSNDDDDHIAPVSRADVAQVCVSALLDPNALNKCVYMTKKKSTNFLVEEDISSKFLSLDSI